MRAGVTADTRLGGTGMRQPKRVDSANVNTRNHATKRSPSTALFSRDRSYSPDWPGEKLEGIKITLK